MTFKAPAHRSHGSTGLARPAADYRKRGEDSATANEYGRIHAGSQSLVTLESLVQGPGRAGPCIEPPQQHVVPPKPHKGKPLARSASSSPVESCGEEDTPPLVFSPEPFKASGMAASIVHSLPPKPQVTMSKRYYRPPNMRKEECTYVGGRSADKPASMRPRLSPGTARFPGADSGAQLNVPPQKTGASDDDPCGLLRAYTRPNSSSATDSYETSAFVSPSSHGLGGSLIYSSPEPKSDPSAAFFRSFEMAIENGAGVVRSHGSSPLASEQPQYFHQPQHAMPGIGAAFRTGDWVCASSACSFHNFARNDTCFGCGSAKPVSGVSATSEASHVRSPNRSAMPTLTRQPSSLNLGTAYSATSGLAPRHQATSSPQSSDSPSTPDLHSQYLDPFLTTSIRGPLSGPQPLPNLDKVMDMPASQQQPASTLAAAFQLHQMGVGIGPGVNPAISSASPCQGQARGSESKGSSSIDQNNPPIVNTGNSGPMCVQPGDWFCGQCGFVNWRRRKVCMRCYPFAGGNEVAASLANGALLAAQLATGRDPSAQEIAELASPRSRQPSSPPNSVGASSLGLSLGNGTPFTSPTFPDHQNVKTYRSSDPTPNDLAQPGGLAPRLQERASTRSLGSTFEEQFARRMSLTSSSFDSSLSPQRHRAKTYDYFESTSFSLTSSALPLTPPFSLDAKTPGLPPLSPHSFSHHSSSQANHPLQSLSPSPPSSNQPRDIWSSRPAPRPKPIGTDWQPESDVGDAFDPTLGRSSSSSSSSPTKRKMPKPIGTKATPTFQHQAPFDQLPSADNTTTMTRSGYER